ncbi:hypothetical protein lerEdw1_010821 [Lerista edwardsae]|nr:hypothetical protein lerEdw1_010821 [Lerista edwardsae]
MEARRQQQQQQQEEAARILLPRASCSVTSSGQPMTSAGWAPGNSLSLSKGAAAAAAAAAAAERLIAGGRSHPHATPRRQLSRRDLGRPRGVSLAVPNRSSNDSPWTMDHRGSVSTSLPELPCSMSDSIIYGDDEMDEETVKFISALYRALGPLLPEVTKLQGHQDPPAHLMVDMKAKLRELGSSVTDARKRLLRYNIYLKKRLAKAMQARKILKDQQLRQQGEEGSEPLRQPITALVQRAARPEPESGKPSLSTEKSIQALAAGACCTVRALQASRLLPPPQEIPSELLRTKALERVHRRSMRLQDSRFSSGGEASTTGLQESADDRPRPFTSPQGILQRNSCRPDTSASHTSFDKSQQ